MKIHQLILVLTLFTFSTSINAQTFLPEGGKKYVLSAWVQDETIPANGNDMLGYITLTQVSDAAVSTIEMRPSGLIVDGWQLITQEFNVISGIESMDIRLIPSSVSSTYFDDIRIFPFNGTMKSFVYDSDNQRLMAELDDNNFATFYEYDQEGGLIRVKKETERGIFTIQETRSSSTKLNN